MKKYLKVDPWLIIEEQFNAENHKSSESIFSIGNGLVGQRANFSNTLFCLLLDEIIVLLKLARCPTKPLPMLKMLSDDL